MPRFDPPPAPPVPRRTTGRRVGLVAGACTGAVALVVAAALQTAHGEPSRSTSATGNAASVTSASPSTDSTTSTTSEPTTAAASTPTGSASPALTATTPAATPTSAQAPAAKPGTALAALATLRVAGRAPKTGYDRDRFGQAWADVDRNGCDTRNDVLRRDLTRYTLKAGTHGCLVLKGTLHDPYTGRTISFVRGQTTSLAVQVDHVVALSDAWQKGAQGWSLSKRTAFANDSLNLLAVDGPTNARKGDGDAASWLPPAKSYRCAYVARQVAVKRTYGLWMTRAEKDAVARVLATCPGQKLPSATAFRLGGGTVVTVPVAPRTSTTTAPSTSGTDLRFGTCKEASSHGYGPYQRGVDPEYAWYRDADGDGWVCE